MFTLPAHNETAPTVKVYQFECDNLELHMEQFKILLFYKIIHKAMDWSLVHFNGTRIDHLIAYCTIWSSDNANMPLFSNSISTSAYNTQINPSEEEGRIFANMNLLISGMCLSVSCLAVAQWDEIQETGMNPGFMLMIR